MTLQPLLGVDGIRSLRWVLKGFATTRNEMVNLREEKE
jgi:hypothetical protein